MKARSTRAVALVLMVVMLVAACGEDDDGIGAITVFAAASLTDAFTEMGDAFESANPRIGVAFNFAASSALREQILAGAPADVFASANTSNMGRVIDGGAAVDASPFATNRLQIAVPRGNDAGVTGLGDFARSDLLIGLCAEEAPCGELGRHALESAGVDASIDTHETDVRALLTKIEAGELDAGLVYVTDVRAAGDAVEAIDIPDDNNVVATYPIAALADSTDGDAARSFVAFVVSERGQAILASYGFGPA